MKRFNVSILFVMLLFFSFIVPQSLIAASRAIETSQYSDLARHILGSPPWEKNRNWCFDLNAAICSEHLKSPHSKPWNKLLFCCGNKFLTSKTGSIYKNGYTETSSLKKLPPSLFRTKPPPQCKGRILLVGDSLMQGLSPSMRELFSEKRISVITAAKPATGITNTQFYSWERQLPALVETHQPDVILFLLGANDIQGMSIKGRTVAFGTKQWIQEYRSRIATLIGMAGAARVYWVGIPRMKSSRYNKNVTMLNALFRDTVTQYDGTFIPTDEVFGPRKQPYSPYAHQEGKRVRVRTNDGIHMSMKGYKMITEAVARRVLVYASTCSR